MNKPHLYVDGDGCPVKEDVYRVAKRYGLKVFMVCNSPMRIPKDSDIEPIIVGGAFDAVDDWICEHVIAGDLVVTNDIPFSARCLQKGAFVIDPRGKILSEDNIGDALATRELMTDLRARGELHLGPKPMKKNHRSQFLSNLDLLINKARKSRGL